MDMFLRAHSPYDVMILSIRARIDANPNVEHPETRAYREACFDILEEVAQLRLLNSTDDHISN